MQEIRHNLVAGGSTEGAEPIQGHLEKKEALLDELSNWFENVSEENFDEAALDELLDSLQEVDPLESSFDPVASREAFCREHQAEFEKIEAQTAEDISGKKHSRFPLRRVFVIAAAIAVVLGVMLTAQGSGFDLGDLFARWTSSVFGYSETKSEYATIGAYPIGEGEEKEYESLQAALDDFGVKGDVAPAWMPEGFEETVVAKVTRAGAAFYADYLSDDGRWCSMKVVEHDSAKQTLVEKDSENMKVRKTNGISHYFVSDLDLEKVTWINGKLECKISGNITHEEMKSIIDSIYED